MLEVHKTITIDAAPERVWAVAGDPAIIARWLPVLAISRPDGDRRSCITVDGAELRERIVERNETERYYVCAITESSMPLRSHRSVLAVHGRGGQSHVGWSAQVRRARRRDRRQPRSDVRAGLPRRPGEPSRTCRGPRAARMSAQAGEGRCRAGPAGLLRWVWLPRARLGRLMRGSAPGPRRPRGCGSCGSTETAGGMSRPRRGHRSRRR